MWLFLAMVMSGAFVESTVEKGANLVVLACRDAAYLAAEIYSVATPSM